MSALSAFVRQKNGEWVLEKPNVSFKEDELIRRAVQQFRALERDVALMGGARHRTTQLIFYNETIVGFHG